MDNHSSRPTSHDAAKAYVALAQKYLFRAIKTDTTELPGKDFVKFYFMTNHRKFTALENIDYITDSASIWFPLIDQGNTVITALRMLTTETDGGAIR